MHASFLQYLIDPKTYEDLELICNKKEGEIIIERFLSSFSRTTPSYQNSHDFYEVFQWFKECGMAGIEPSKRGGISMHGIKL